MKYYTTVRQSRKLVRLGLDPNTADMVYLKFASSDNLTPRFEGAAPMVLMDIPINEIDCETLPCWSLGALLELMPTFLILENIPYLLYVKKYNQRYEIYYANNGFTPKGIIESNTSIKAFYSMICWLLENNYIEK